jgi:two-component system, sensor histidine kinase and response regulator
MSSVEAEQPNNASREIVNSLGGIVWRMDSNSQSLTQINNAVETLLGYTVEECLRSKTIWSEGLHEDDKERLNHELQQGITFYDTVLRRRKKDGTYCWLREIVNIVGEKNKPTFMFGISIDAANVVQQRDETQLILDTVPAMVWFKDRENRILHINKAAADSIGRSADDLIGRSCYEIYPDEAQMYYEDDLAVIQSGQPKVSIIEQILTANGDKKWVQTDKIPCRDANGAIIGVIVFSVDITQKKIEHEELYQARALAEHSLKETEARLENLARHMPGLIYQFILQADGAGSFPYVSESCRTLTEYEPQELQSDPELVFGSVIHPDDRIVMQQAIEESMTTMSIFKFEGRIVTRSGKVRWVQASSIPEAQPNGDVLWNGMMMDISDLKSAQDKIKHLNQDLAQRVGILASVNRELELLTHKLEVAYDQALQASRLKSEFVANISHEVRTPISAVIGMSDLLLDTALTDEQKQFAKIVRESAESLLTIINDILDFSKIEAGKIELESIDFSINSILASCAELLSSTARRKGLELITEIDPSIPSILSGDPVRLRQILLNLTSNAIKFTESGEVVLRAVQVARDQGRTLLKIEVIDTGIGLSDEGRLLLFQPFVQADGSTTRRYGGTGLGLSICKRLVELMGGEIGVRSAEGEGSTFWFTVPFIHEQELRVPGDLNNAKVLVVDQAQGSRIILENYLSAAQIKTSFTNAAATTMEQLHRAAQDGEPFNIVIVNLSNESIDAFELSQYILESPILGCAKIVFLTSFDEREKVNKALSMGISSCLTKPIRQVQLLETIRNLCADSPLANSEVQPTAAISAAMSAQQQAPSLSSETAPRYKNDRPILLAEDNPVMQELGVRQLKKMGITAHPVSSGVQVVAAVKSGDYALILMDCQMPEMDGFEATRVIRDLEKSTGKHIPIIAMTASAMRGDRENCIAAGMDDYMSKPVGKQQLLSVLTRWLGEDGPPLPTLDRHIPAILDCGGPLDVVKLKALYGEESTPELLHSFIGESEKLLNSIKHHLEQHNDKDLATEAHQLKGLSAVMTIEDLERLSQELERAAKQSSWEQAGEICQRLETCFETVTNFIKRLLE